MLSHKLKAEWEGVAMNTSSEVSNAVWGGSKKHFGYYGGGIDVYEHTNGWVYYVTGFSENNVALRKFHLDNPDEAVYLKRSSSTLYAEEPGQKAKALAAHYTLASDGQYLYVPSITSSSTTTNVHRNYVWIMKFDLSTDQLAPFSKGVSISPGTYNYSSVILLKSNLGKNETWAYNFTGVAVDNNYLYTAQADGAVRTFNKITGDSITYTSAIKAPRRMASDGKDIWMIHGEKSLSKFSVRSGVLNTTPVLSLSGLIDPQAFSVQTVGGVQY
ncbi:MAG: hypothetical protein EOP49_42430, partial [Sphingobacteriales bacterium]